MNPGIGCEIGIWNEEEYQESKCFYVFAGVEVDRLDDMPLELVGRVLPAGTCAQMTARGKEITTWERAFCEERLPGSGDRVPAQNGYQFQIQAYEDDRFHGLGDML